MKRGSISISMNMVVVVVLAFVMLGLFVVLGRTMLEGSTEAAYAVLERSSKNIGDLIDCERELCFSQKLVEMKRNDVHSFRVGVQNLNNDAASYQMKFYYRGVDITRASGGDIITDGEIVSGVNDAYVRCLAELAFDSDPCDDIGGNGREQNFNFDDPSGNAPDDEIEAYVLQTYKQISAATLVSEGFEREEGWVEMTSSDARDRPYGSFLWTSVGENIAEGGAILYNVEYKPPQFPGANQYQIRVLSDADGTFEEVERHTMTIVVD